MKKESQIAVLLKWKYIVQILCFLSFGLGNEINSQTIVKRNLIWSAISFRLTPEATLVNNQSEFTKFDFDTIIDGLHYLRVFRSEDSLMLNWNIVGHIRETENRVFFRDIYKNVEYPLYDFNLKIDDIFLSNIFLSNPDTFKVTTVDTITLFGRSLKRIILKHSILAKTETWIEGIGSLQGVTRSCYKGTGRWTLLCQYEDSELWYHDSAFAHCYYSPNRFVLTITRISENNTINIYPNPFQKFISINSKVPFNKIEIHDLSGRIIFSKTFFQNTKYSGPINLNIETPGLYYLVLFSGANRISKPIIKTL